MSKPPSPKSAVEQIQSYNIPDSPNEWDDLVYDEWWNNPFYYEEDYGVLWYWNYGNNRWFRVKETPKPPAIIGKESDQIGRAHV